MGSVLRFPKGGRIEAPADHRTPHHTEERFRYPATDEVAEVSCSHEPPRKRVIARAPRVPQSA
jgi:hypothetical protein